MTYSGNPIPKLPTKHIPSFILTHSFLRNVALDPEENDCAIFKAIAIRLQTTDHAKSLSIMYVLSDCLKLVLQSIQREVDAPDKISIET